MPPYSLRILKRNYSPAAGPSHLAYEAVTLYDCAFQRIRLMFWIGAAPHLHAFCKAGFGSPCAAFIRITRRIAFAFFSCGY